MLKRFSGYVFALAVACLLAISGVVMVAFGLVTQIAPEVVNAPLCKEGVIALTISGVITGISLKKDSSTYTVSE